MASPLENLSGPGKPLREEPPDEKEFSGLKRSALARVAIRLEAHRPAGGRAPQPLKDLAAWELDGFQNHE